MTLARMEHSGNASPTTLQIAINSAAASIVTVSGVGFPTGAVGTFVIVIDPDLANEEKILCSSRSINTFTVAPSGRGWDGTTAADHSSNAQIKHVFTANEADDMSDHIYSPTTRDDHTQYLSVARHDITSRHTFGAAFAIPTAATVSAVGDGPGPGVATGPARADHIHGREPWPAGLSTAIPPNTTAADGTSLSPARADHVHSRAASETFTNVTASGTVTAGSVVVGGATVMPPGVIQMYGTSTAPTGWLLCDGSAVSRTGATAALFAVIGTSFGVGDGSTTFNLPDLQGRVAVGQGTGSGLTARTLAGKVGEENHPLTTGELATHNHSITDPSHNHGDAGHGHTLGTTGAGGISQLILVNWAGSGEGLATPVTGSTHATGTVSGIANTGFANIAANFAGINNTNNNGSGTAHNTMQPSLVVAFIIKT